MDYDEPDYEPTIKENQVEILKFVIEDNCSIEQTFRKGAPDEPDFSTRSDAIRVISKNDNTSPFEPVEPELMESLCTQGLMRFTAEDYPNNDRWRLRFYHPVEPDASEFLARHKHLLN